MEIYLTFMVHGFIAGCSSKKDSVHFNASTQGFIWQGRECCDGDGIRSP